MLMKNTCTKLQNLVITMKSMFLWVITPCNLDLLHLIRQSACHAKNWEKQAGFLLALLLNSEDGDNMFL
jgi:hypothetical protein